MTTVGRWMSKTEYEMMVKTGRMVEGAGGQTFVATGGPGAFNAAAKGSVYVEFQVSKRGGNVDFWGLGWIGIFVWDYETEEQLLNVLLEPHQEKEKEQAFKKLRELL